MIIFVDVQDVLDIESDEQISVDGDILGARFISQIGEVDQESEKCFPERRKDAQYRQIRIIFFEYDFLIRQFLIEIFADPKIQVIDILLDAIDILLGQLILEDLQELLVVYVLRDILIHGSDEFLVGEHDAVGNLFPGQISEKLDDFLILDIEPDVFGIDILQNRREEGLIE